MAAFFKSHVCEPCDAKSFLISVPIRILSRYYLQCLEKVRMSPYTLVIKSLMSYCFQPIHKLFESKKTIKFSIELLY